MLYMTVVGEGGARRQHQPCVRRVETVEFLTMTQPFVALERRAGCGVLQYLGVTRMIAPREPRDGRRQNTTAHPRAHRLRGVLSFT